MSNEPIILIPKTIIIDVIIDNIRLYTFVLLPVAFAKFSSKIIKNILLYKNTKNINIIIHKTIVIFTSNFDMPKIEPNR